MYDDVLQEGVPDRFRDLLNELNDQGAGAQPSPGSDAREENDPESDRLVEARGSDNPDLKGSH
jgi:hypothetical protein